MGIPDPEDEHRDSAPAARERDASEQDNAAGTAAAVEIGGPKGLEPTRYGDWERNGRCSDF